MFLRQTIHLLALAMLLATFNIQAQVPEDATWIDVRTPAEFAEGHIENAELIPFDRIDIGIQQLGVEKSAPLYLYCGTGGRSGFAKKRLEALGYTNVTNVGGLEDARALSGK